MPVNVNVSLVEIAPQFASAGSIPWPLSQAIVAAENVAAGPTSTTVTLTPSTANVGTREPARLAWRITVAAPTSPTLVSNTLHARVGSAAAAATTTDQALAFSTTHYLAVTQLGERLSLITSL